MPKIHTACRLVVAPFATILLVSMLPACGVLLPSENLVNYALQDGVVAKMRSEADATPSATRDAPAIVDGDRRTSQMATEAYVVLPRPRPIRKVVIRAPDVTTMDLFVRQSERTGWRMRRSYDNLPRSPVEEDLSDLDQVDAVEVRIRSSLRDAVWGATEAQRILGRAADRAMRELLRGPGNAWQTRQGLGIKRLDLETDEPVLKVARRVHAPIYEIELLGPPPDTKD